MKKLKTILALAFILAFGLSSYATVSVSPSQPITGCVDTFRTTILGTNYSWNFGPNSYPETLSGPTYIVAGTAFLTAGNHTVKVTVTTVNGPVVDSLIVNVQASGSNISITASGPLCQSNSITYTASTGYIEYAFFVNDSLKQLSTSNTYTASLLSGDSVRVFGLAGTCFSNSSAVLHVSSPLPPHLISSVPSDTICSGQLVTFTAQPASYDTFFFYVGGSLQQATPSSTWSYSQLYDSNMVHVEVHKNGCGSGYSNIITFKVYPNPQITDTASATGICQGSTISVAAYPDGLSDYKFYINSALVQNDTSHTYTSANFHNNDTVTVTGTLHGCTSTLTKPIVISVGTQPTVTLSPQTDTICQGSAATYTASPSTYGEYLFYVNSTLVQDSASNTFTSTTLTNLSTISVVAVNHGCQSVRVGGFPISVIPGALPTLSNYRHLLCYGLSDTITVNTGGSETDTYLWSTGATTASVVLGAGPFSVTVTNTTSNSCGAIIYDTIVGDPQIHNTNILTLHLCDNPAHGDFKLDGQGGTGLLTYSVVGIDTSNTTGIFAGLAPGNYSYTITDSLGCAQTGNTSIPNSIAGDSFAIITDSVTCFGFNNGEIIITPQRPQDGPFVYSVDGSGFGFNDTFTGIAPGLHNIVVKQFVFGCEYNYTASVGEPTQYTVNVPDTIFSLPGKVDTIMAVTTFPNPVYSWSPVNNLLGCDTCNPTFFTADTINTVYTVKVNTAGDGGCYAVDSGIIVVVPPVLPDSFIMPSAFTPNGDGRNDAFGPVTSMKYTTATIKSFKIYNRWGQLVFNGNAPWDGKFDGKEQPVGTYVYYIEVQYPATTDNGLLTFKKEGSVTLLR